MIRFEQVKVVGFEPAIRGMRNPLESWEKSDSGYGCENTLCTECGYSNMCENINETEACEYVIGANDLTLMLNLAKAGSEHAKYRRMIVVYCDITAPLYWWKEFDTYKIGTVANSCSTMHMIHKKQFELEEFSYERLSSCREENDDSWIDNEITAEYPLDILIEVIRSLNKNRALYLASKDKRYWWNMIQLLPASYNQHRTVMLNYEILASIYRQREGHKLDEWQRFREWIETLPYSEIITLKGNSLNV